MKIIQKNMKFNKRELVNKPIGRKIDKLRIRNSMTKSRFSKYIGISRPTLDKVYAGDLNTNTGVLMKISKGLGVSISYLLKGF